MNLTTDYSFNSGSDATTGITISKNNFILNGNGHTIDSMNLARLFTITGNNVTLKI